MICKIVILATIITSCIADKDDKKWVWDGNSRSSNARSVLSNPNSKNRYNVFEETDEYRPVAGNQFFGSSQPGPIYQRPTPIYQNIPDITESRPPHYQTGPPVSGVGFIPEERPGGVYGSGYRPTYGGQGNYSPEGAPGGVYGNGYRPTYGGQGNYGPEGETPAILTGPVPSWVKEGPIKDFDKCKCAEKFNCNSPGISYGHCDEGKKYCCYSSKKLPGGPTPSHPVHSIENGVLVGPGGPSNAIPGITAYPRPQKQIGGGFYRPGGFQGHQGPRPLGGNYYGGRPDGFAPNEYSPANGVLVGPGGPYDGPNPGFGLERSAKTNIKAKN